MTLARNAQAKSPERSEKQPGFERAESVAYGAKIVRTRRTVSREIARTDECAVVVQLEM